MMKRNATTVIPASEFAAEAAMMLDALAHGDLSEPLSACAHLADEEFGRNFAAMAGPHSGAWAPRKQGGTGQGKGEGHPLEIKSGAMFQAETSPFGEGHIENVGPRSAEIGVDPEIIPYAAAQNYGHTYQNPLRVLPQRESMDVSDQVADRMAEEMADGWLEVLG
jgi:hypothetical protein